MHNLVDNNYFLIFSEYLYLHLMKDKPIKKKAPPKKKPSPKKDKLKIHADPDDVLKVLFAKKK